MDELSRSACTTLCRSALFGIVVGGLSQWSSICFLGVVSCTKLYAAAGLINEFEPACFEKWIHADSRVITDMMHVHDIVNLSLSFSLTHTHTHSHARERAHARTHARTHTHTHTHRHTHTHTHTAVL